MYIVSIDPGLRASGVALFDNTELRAASWVRSPSKEDGAEAWVAMGWAIACYAAPYLPGTDSLIFVAEVPQIYHGRREDTDLNDLPPLAGVVGAAAAFFYGRSGGVRQYVSYYPHDWKSNVPKAIKVARIWAEIDKRPGERARVALPPGRKKGSVGKGVHNIVDACGIGLRFLRERNLR